MNRVPLSNVPQIASTRFSLNNSGGHHNLVYPWKDIRSDDTPFLKRLAPGWRVIGQCVNSALATGPRRYEGPDGSYGKYVAVMFTNPDGWDYFFHLEEREHVFEEIALDKAAQGE